ncbi:MAG TPA: sigma-70 family RNA polymerase sigma factor [Verrucomicrobiae bacterium]|nr:sigma-70 family RNA polymerase sigma factor [Verrucomicrobiae bacterium]
MKSNLFGLADGELAQRYLKTGDTACFDELAGRHWNRVLGYCRKVVRGAEAEELAQETFLRALIKLDQFQGGSFAGWLLSLAKTVCLNRVAKADWRTNVPLEDAPPSASDGEHERLLEDSVRRMLQALERLPQPQRLCIKLFDLDGYSYDETARLSGYSLGEVKSHLQNGRRMLRKLLAQGGNES